MLTFKKTYTVGADNFYDMFNGIYAYDMIKKQDLEMELYRFIELYYQDDETGYVDEDEIYDMLRYDTDFLFEYLGCDPCGKKIDNKMLEC